jgi:hypothetical protein
MKITFNGALVNGRIDGTETFEITLRRTDNAGKTTRSFSSELTFYDDGYQTIKTLLIDDPDGFGKKIDVEIYDSCCSEPVFVGIIRGDSLDWCEPDCSVTANVIENERQYDCIESKPIMGQFIASPVFVNYCLEGRPKWWHIILGFLMALLGNIISTVLLPFILVILVISAVFFVICSIVCFLSNDCDQDTCDEANLSPNNILDSLLDGLQDSIGFFDTCNRKHPTGLVREYMANLCAQCGLNFQSSILTDASSPYFNTLLFSATIQKGLAENILQSDMIVDNNPIETGQTFLDNLLKPTFNGDWQIIGNTLFFERKDYFLSTTTWIDSEQLMNDDRIVDRKICFSWIDDERFAFGRYEYVPDAIDIIGNEAMKRYSDIVEWNIPFSPVQKGQLVNTLPFSPARFRSDGIDGEGTIWEILAAFQGGLLNLFFGGQLTSGNGNSLLMNQHTAMNYKLLIWDGVDKQNATIKHDYPTAFTGGNVIVDNEQIPTSNLFNYPLWFKEGYNNNLYSLFHYIDNPKLPSARNFNFDFEFQFNCSDLTNFDFSKTVRIIQNGTAKNGQVKEIKINFINRTMSVSGIV